MPRSGNAQTHLPTKTSQAAWLAPLACRLLTVTAVLALSRNPGHAKPKNGPKPPRERILDGGQTSARFQDLRASWNGDGAHGLPGGCTDGTGTGTAWAVLSAVPACPSAELLPPGIKRRTVLRTVRDHVVPELLRRHQPATAQQRPAPDPWPENLPTQLACMSRNTDPEPARQMLHGLERSGVRAEALRDRLLPAAAQAVEEAWLQDRCSGFDRTLGLCHLRAFALELTSRMGPSPSECMGGRVAFWSPEQDHVAFAPILHECLLRRAGWTIDKLEGTSVAQVVRHHRLRKVDLLICTVHRKDLLDEIRGALRSVRRLSRNRRIRILGVGRALESSELTLPQLAVDAVMPEPEDAMAFAATAATKRRATRASRAPSLPSGAIQSSSSSTSTWACT
jgi:hypothetical protein